MIGNRRCAFALATVFTIFGSIAPATAAQFDGNWSMVAVTTSGHCGQIPIGLGISRGRIYSTGGSFASYPIQLGGRISSSGQVQMKAVAGPRIAHGIGGSIGFGAAGPGAVPGPPVSARAFGAPFAPKAHFLTRRLAARPNEGDRCHCNGRLANPD